MQMPSEEAIAEQEATRAQRIAELEDLLRAIVSDDERGDMPALDHDIGMAREFLKSQKS